MSAGADRQALLRAEAIFEAIGAGMTELKLYAEQHPRFRRILDSIRDLTAEYFEKHPASSSLTFLLTGGQAEFRRVPLVNLSAHGKRLEEALGALGAGALRLERGITAEAAAVLVKCLGRRDAGTAPVAAEPREGGPGFRIIPEDEARLLSLARDRGFSADDGDTGILLPEFRVSEDIFENILRSYSALFSSLESGGSFDYGTLKSSTDQAVQLFAGRKGAAAALVSKCYFDDFTFHHSVNVSLIATRIASAVLKDDEMVGRISLAALLHDVGKTRIPAEVVYKPARLTPAEFKVLQAHPVLGAEILLGVDGIDPMCVNVAFGHHLHAGVNSYPRIRKAYATDWVMELISVVDIYEALTAVRPYKKALTPEKALQVMFSMYGLRTRLPLVKMLYDFQGRYPVGSIVELTTGERAAVLERNPAAANRPRVRVLTDGSRKVLSTPRDLDLSLPPAAGEERVEIARAIVQQSPDSDPLTGDVEELPELGGSGMDDEAFLMQEG